jgi:NAD(P)-dependent dehydrogenase (short-subunit alcohol dehydrogenase family)
MSFWKDKTVICTGATSGLGKSLTFSLLERGAKVAFCGKSREKMDEVLGAIPNSDTAPIFYDTFDITDGAAVTSFVQNTELRLGSVHALINCAGVNSARATIENIDIVDLEWMLKVNLTAPLRFIKECYRSMSGRRDGLIVNILSTCCLFSNEGLGAYTASKYALDGLTKVLRKEARKNGIRVCSVYPGGIDTPFRPQKREDYLTPRSAAEAILNALEIDPAVAMDEIVLRPFVETNYC